MKKSHENDHDHQEHYLYDRETKMKFYVSDEVYKEMCRYTDAYRQRMQYNGQCACRREDWQYCNTVCVGCRYRRISETGKNSFAACTGKKGKKVLTYEIISMDEEVDTDEGTYCLGDFIADPNADVEDAIIKKQAREALERELEPCDELGRKIIDLRIDGYTHAEVAEKLGLTRGQYRRRFKKVDERIVPGLRDYFY